MAWNILEGDVRQVLPTLPDNSVHCVVTSPPYWGLRDYGTAGQIGLEPNLDEWLAIMVQVFRDVRRVLRDDGTLWLNMGDSYNTGTSTPSKPSPETDNGYWQKADKLGRSRLDVAGLKTKDLVGQPWRLAFALQADGWYLRSDIIWSKPNPMPESVTDRPTKAHEYVFLMSKRERYFYDAEAVREPHKTPIHLQERRVAAAAAARTARVAGGDSNALEKWSIIKPEGARISAAGRNLRTVWPIATHAFPEAHFATFPPKLAERCIKAGTSERGCCPTCGAPWERVVERGELTGVDRGGNYAGRSVDDLVRTNPGTPGMSYEQKTIGWRSTCTHVAEPIPCTVLDPFAGAGTTGLVALRLGRSFTGIELNPKYAAMARRRITDDAPLFNSQDVEELEA